MKKQVTKRTIYARHPCPCGSFDRKIRRKHFRKIDAHHDVPEVGRVQNIRRKIIIFVEQTVPFQKHGIRIACGALADHAARFRKILAIVRGGGTYVGKAADRRHQKNRFVREAAAKVLKIGINDVFGESGPALELIEKYGLDAKSIYKKVKDFVNGV